MRSVESRLAKCLFYTSRYIVMSTTHIIQVYWVYSSSTYCMGLQNNTVSYISQFPSSFPRWRLFCSQLSTCLAACMATDYRRLLSSDWRVFFSRSQHTSELSLRAKCQSLWGTCTSPIGTRMWFDLIGPIIIVTLNTSSVGSNIILRKPMWDWKMYCFVGPPPCIA